MSSNTIIQGLQPVTLSIGEKKSVINFSIGILSEAHSSLHSIYLLEQQAKSKALQREIQRLKGIINQWSRNYDALQSKLMQVQTTFSSSLQQIKRQKFQIQELERINQKYEETEKHIQKELEESQSEKKELELKICQLTNQFSKQQEMSLERLAELKAQKILELKNERLKQNHFSIDQKVNQPKKKLSRESIKKKSRNKARKKQKSIDNLAIQSSKSRNDVGVLIQLLRQQERHMQEQTINVNRAILIERKQSKLFKQSLMKWIQYQTLEHEREKEICCLLREIGAFISQWQITDKQEIRDYAKTEITLYKTKVFQLQQNILKMGGNPDQVDPRSFMLQCQLELANSTIRQLRGEISFLNMKGNFTKEKMREATIIMMQPQRSKVHKKRKSMSMKTIQSAFDKQLHLLRGLRKNSNEKIKS